MGPGAAKEQDITLRVPQLEATQTVIRILERLRELDISRCILSSQRIRIRNIQVSVPASCRLPPAVWEWIDANVLEKTHRPAAPHDAEEEVVAKACEHDLKAKAVAIERERSRDVSHDEERRATGDC